jgi:hypothetical protein
MKWLCAFFSIFLFSACKDGNKKDPKNEFFPVVSFLKGQARGVDTTLNTITLIESSEGDTVRKVIHRKEFRNYAADFLELPDITTMKYAGDYNETEMYDQFMDRFIFTYLPKEDDQEIKREDVILYPTNKENNTQVESIVIRRVMEEGDSIMDKTMVWYTDKRFTIITKIQKDEEPEKVRKIEVIWNDFSGQ